MKAKMTNPELESFVAKAEDAFRVVAHNLSAAFA